MPDIPLKNDETVNAFLKRHPKECAATTLATGQFLRYELILIIAAFLFCYDWKIFAASLLFAVSAFYVAVIAYKLLTVFLSLLKKPEIHVSREEIAALVDDDLPVYTILVPLYKEPEVAAKIVRTIDGFDYPHSKLDVKLLLEEDDEETQRCLENATLPACVDIMVVPHAMPKTKPKACNHGLLKAKGELLVIYDAEDRPDCDQLKKAVVAFRKSSQNVVCLQAKLNYYNPNQNILTKWFTLEYSAWFDLFLPGLHDLDVPIPLGGTSNHFRTSVLQKIGGWDPFNLTEDCDLGIRLHRMGHRTQVLDSTTWEEANSQLGNWIRQRSRWIKGYIQTHFVHTRSNFKTLFQLGPKSFASFILTVSGLSATLLLNPLFWLIGLIYIALAVGHATGLTHFEPWQFRYYNRVADLPGAPLTLWSELSLAFWGAAIGLLTANAMFVLVNIAACFRRKLWHLVPYAIISPIYWVLISVAAWKGFLQLFNRPFYWEKTQHGLGNNDEGACHLPEMGKEGE
ncbi:MAG: glycosyltransferase [Planctomycetes bacterium]|nr:glycosyltransferase [Planctomycetota bacterium]